MPINVCGVVKDESATNASPPPRLYLGPDLYYTNTGLIMLMVCVSIKHQWIIFALVLIQILLTIHII